MAFLVIISALTAGVFKVMPTGFVPSEDNAFVMMNVTLPEGISQTETKQVSEKISKWLEQQPGVTNVMNVVGFSILADEPKSNGSASFIGMSDWDQRKDKSLSVDALVGKIMAMGNQIPQATVIAMNPPPIDGMGTSSGFTMQLETAAAIRRQNCRRRLRNSSPLPANVRKSVRSTRPSLPIRRAISSTSTAIKSPKKAFP